MNPQFLSPVESKSPSFLLILFLLQCVMNSKVMLSTEHRVFVRLYNIHIIIILDNISSIFSVVNKYYTDVSGDVTLLNNFSVERN